MDKRNLLYFKDVLEKRKIFIEQELNKNLQTIKDLKDSAPSDKIDFLTIDTNSKLEFLINANLKEELKHIDISLIKIKNNNFGICELCDGEIRPERLKIKPHAKYCIECRQIIEKE